MSIYDKGWLMRFLNPENQPKQIQDYLNQEIKLLLRYVSPKSCLIDFGCGFGRHLELLQKKLSYGLGIDTIDEYIAAGNKRLKRFSNLELIKADALNFNIENKFDYAICMNNTLGNIAEKEKLILQMKKATKPEGKLIAGVYSNKSIDSRIKWYNKTGLKIKKITNEFILTDNGFKSWHFTKKQLYKLFNTKKVENIADIGYFIKVNNNFEL